MQNESPLRKSFILETKAKWTIYTAINLTRRVVIVIIKSIITIRMDQ